MQGPFLHAKLHLFQDSSYFGSSGKEEVVCAKVGGGRAYGGGRRLAEEAEVGSSKFRSNLGPFTNDAIDVVVQLVLSRGWSFFRH